MGAQQSQMVNEDDNQLSKRERSPYSQDYHSDRDNHNGIDIDSSQHDQPVFSSQLPSSARHDRMNGTKSKKRRTLRSIEGDEGLSPNYPLDFDPPFKSEPSVIRENPDKDTATEIKGDPYALDDDPVAVLEDEEFGAEVLEKAKQERRERKEKKRARKAERLRLSQLKANTDAGIDATDVQSTGELATSQTNGVSPEVYKSNGFVAVNHIQHAEDEQALVSSEAVEVSKRPKRRKLQAVAAPVADDEVMHEVIQDEENGQNSEADKDDPFKSQPLVASSANESVVLASSPLKRKSQHLSDKKQRKKQKQQMDNFEEVEEDGEGASVTQMSVPFDDAVQDIYSQRYDAQTSPSAARLQRRSPTRSDSVEAEQSDNDITQHMKQERVPESDEEDGVSQSMDVDEDNDDDLPANNHNVERDPTEDVTDNGTEIPLGSDDLGVAEPMEVDRNSSDDRSDENAVPTPDAQSSRRSLRSKTSTGRKRHAKLPFNGLDDGEENNRQAFEQLPPTSPTATVAKRRRRRHDAAEEEEEDKGAEEEDNAAEEEDEAAAVPSSTAKGKGRAPGSRGPRKVKDPAKGEEITGPFSEFELRNIDRALKHWQEDHNLTDYERNELIHKNPQEAAQKAANCGALWDAIQAVVPGRKRQKVISQCRRRYHNFSARGSWTPEQHEELVKLYAEHGNKYRIIADLINRYPEDVRDRIRNYVVCGNSLKTATWDADEELQLTNIIHASLEQIRANRGDPDAEENRGTKEEELIDWQGVSEGMKRRRSRLQCINKWKKIKAAMENKHDDVDPNEPMEQIIDNAREEAMQIPGGDLYRIAKLIKETGAARSARIPWSKVHAKGAGAKYSRPALMVAWFRLRTLVPHLMDSAPGDIVKALRPKFQEEGDLELPTDIDLEEEYQELEHRIGIILNNRKPKSAYLAIKSDDNEEQDDEASDADIGIGPSSSKIPTDREIEESDLGESPSTKAKGNPKGKAKEKAKREAKEKAKAARKRPTSRKSKGKGKALSKSIVSDEQSSDTDAADAQDIPARV